MMFLIQSKGRIKCSELADILEVSERQIQKYKQDLEQAGIFINSKAGKYGGYELDNSNMISNASLTEKELCVLEMINEQLKYNNDIYKSEFEDVFIKIKAISKEKDSIAQMDYFSIQPQCNYDYFEEKQKFNDIRMAYITKRKLEIDYYSLNSGYSNRIVHPYGLYNYKSDQYMVAFCEKRNDFIDFKLCRVKSYSILDDNYEISKSFTWKEYSKDSIGIYKDNKIDVVLKINHPFSVIIKEKIWVENQEILEHEDESITFKATMRGYTEIKSWVLSMGANVEVVQPSSLREEIKLEIEKIKKLY